MPGDFGELTVNIGLSINFLAGGTFYFNSNDTLSYISCVLYTKEQLVALNALNLRITCSFSLNNSYCPESHH